MPQIDLAAEVARGQEATNLLEHPLMSKAFEDIRKGLMQAWLDSPVRDAEGRESIFYAVKMLDNLKGALKEHITTGKMAAVQLVQMNGETKNAAH